MDIASFLPTVEAFKDLTEADIKLLASRAGMDVYFDSQVIINEGERGRFLWVIFEGSVEILKGGKSLAVLGPGQVIGEVSLLMNQSTTANVVAKGKCKAIKIPGDIFCQVVKKDTKSMGRFTRTATKRLIDNVKGS